MLEHFSAPLQFIVTHTNVQSLGKWTDAKEIAGCKRVLIETELLNITICNFHAKKFRDRRMLVATNFVAGRSQSI